MYSIHNEDFEEDWCFLPSNDFNSSVATIMNQTEIVGPICSNRKEFVSNFFRPLIWNSMQSECNFGAVICRNVEIKG